jgi:hypothetical protein
MFFYIILLCIAWFFAFIYSFSKSKEIGFLAKILCFLTLFIPAAIRYNISTDYQAYVSIYNDVASNKNPHGEAGFLLLNKIIYILGGNAQCVFALVAFLTYFFLFKSVTKKIFLLVIPVYIMLYYIPSYNIMRQVLSVTIVYYAMKKYEKKEWLLTLFYFCLASFFHISAILFLLYFLVCSMLNIKRHTSFLLCLSVYMLINIFNVIDIFFKLAKLTSYAVYLQTGYIRQTEFRSGLSFLIYFLMIFTLLVGIKGKNRMSSNARIGLILFFFMALMGIKIFILNRLRDGFMITLLPALENVNNKSKYRKIIISVFLLFSLASFFGLLLNGKGSFIPYNHILSK